LLAKEQAAMAEVAFVLGPRVIRCAERLHVDDFDVSQFEAARATSASTRD
jgi:hypothetical protein